MMNWFYRLGIAHHHARREGETIKSPMAPSFVLVYITIQLFEGS